MANEGVGDGGRATSTCLVIWQQWTFNAFHFTRAFDLVYNHVYILPNRSLAHSSTHLHTQTFYQCVSFFPYHFHRYQNELPVFFFIHLLLIKNPHYCSNLSLHEMKTNQFEADIYHNITFVSSQLSEF